MRNLRWTSFQRRFVLVEALSRQTVASYRNRHRSDRRFHRSRKHQRRRQEQIRMKILTTFSARRSIMAPIIRTHFLRTRTYWVPFWKEQILARFKAFYPGTKSTLITLKWKTRWTTKRVILSYRICRLAWRALRAACSVVGSYQFSTDIHLSTEHFSWHRDNSTRAA